MFVDLVVVPEVDLSALRNGITLCAVLVLICGLVFETA